ncbi:MAG TPA: ABC transporter ATP-binding protein [Bacteroidetes bacterium]|nr:ABC transporter ATP-binding protein [Bacteroidota bacterium]
MKETARPLLLLAGLTKRYRRVAALRGLDLTVRPGELVGLIGPDGAGKTTAMRTTCGLLLPDEGRVEILGHDVVRESGKIKRYLGYMPQRFSLYPDLTVAENLRFFADLYGVPKGEYSGRRERLLRFSGLGPFLTRRAEALSGGMKQKLALSCTLIHTPKLLILDEPTFGVDPVSRREFWNILRGLAGEGIGIWVSTAYMEEAQLCDRVLLLHHGEVIAEGTPGEITGRFPHRLLAVTGPDLRIVRRRLEERADLTGGVHRFGSRLHVVYDTDEQAEAIRGELRGLGATLSRVQPGIEDVFVSLMRPGDGREAA